MRLNVHQYYVDGVSGVEYFALKWLCGVDLRECKPKLTKKQRYDRQLEATNIAEEPLWKRVVDVNGVVCFAVCCFLHGFWA
jgi:hypothetical protein